MTTPIADVMPYSVQYFVDTAWWANIPSGQRNSSSYPARHHRLSPGTYRIQWSWKSSVQARPVHTHPSGDTSQPWMDAGVSRFENVSVPPGSWLDLGLYLNPAGADPDVDGAILWVYPMSVYKP